MIIAPEPTNIPPHCPVYQNQFDPVTRAPPFAVRVMETPVQILEGDATAEAGRSLFTETSTLTHEVVFVLPSALTQ